MPGQKINQNQIGLYMKYCKEGKTKSVAAAKSGFSERSAYNVEKRDFQEAKKERKWRTRTDPLEEVFEQELVPMLEKNPHLQAITLLDYLQRKHEGKFPDSLLRTLQRRVRQWRAQHGPNQEIIFRQKHPPGWQGLSDFTSAQTLGITINGESLQHLLYHYRLAYSGWEYAEVVLGGESFTALAENLQNALWECGGVPETHRSDSLSAAFKNLSKGDAQDQTGRYEEFCAHYGMEATRNNRGVSHENGTIESSHRHLKSRLDQALMVRGSRDFYSLRDYRQFVKDVVRTHNRRIKKAHLEELSFLSCLPERKTTDYTEERARVTTSSTIIIKDVIYSVPSRLIGHTLKIHLYDDRLECYVGLSKVATLERKRRGGKRTRQIDYRHLIGSLVKKPGAFKNYVYKESCFPTLAFRQAWEALKNACDHRKACKEYVGILSEAAKEDRETQVGVYLESQLLRGVLPTADGARALFKREPKDVPVLQGHCDDLSSYDDLFVGGIL